MRRQIVMYIYAICSIISSCNIFSEAISMLLHQISCHVSQLFSKAGISIFGTVSFSNIPDLVLHFISSISTAAFRIFRLLLKQNNPNSHAQLMKHDILKPILDLTIQESRRDNLLSCSCHEYFENMRKVRIQNYYFFYH